MVKPSTNLMHIWDADVSLCQSMFQPRTSTFLTVIPQARKMNVKHTRRKSILTEVSTFSSAAWVRMDTLHSTKLEADSEVLRG